MPLILFTSLNFPFKNKLWELKLKILVIKKTYSEITSKDSRGKKEEDGLYNSYAHFTAELESLVPLFLYNTVCHPSWSRGRLTVYFLCLRYALYIRIQKLTLWNVSSIYTKATLVSTILMYNTFEWSLRILLSPAWSKNLTKDILVFKAMHNIILCIRVIKYATHFFFTLRTSYVLF